MYRLYKFRSQINNGPQLISIEKSFLPKIMSYSNIPGKIYFIHYVMVFKYDLTLFNLFKVVCVCDLDLLPQKVYKLKLCQKLNNSKERNNLLK